MTQLLVQGETILARGPFEITRDDIRTTDTIFPLNAIDGWQIVNATVPADFTVQRYSWNGTGLVLSAAALARAEADRVAAIKDQIAQLETSAPVTHRFLRELTLETFQAMEFLLNCVNTLEARCAALQGVPPSPVPMPTPSYGIQLIASLNAEIEALREEL